MLCEEADFALSDDGKLAVQCFAKKQIKDMERHTPWVMKDPRMALAMPLWRPYIPDLVCVLVHKDPVANSISLASNGKKSSQTSTFPVCVVAGQGGTVAAWCPWLTT